LFIDILYLFESKSYIVCYIPAYIYIYSMKWIIFAFSLKGRLIDWKKKKKYFNFLKQEVFCIFFLEIINNYKLRKIKSFILQVVKKII